MWGRGGAPLGPFLCPNPLLPQVHSSFSFLEVRDIAVREPSVVSGTVRGEPGAHLPAGTPTGAWGQVWVQPRPLLLGGDKVINCGWLNPGDAKFSWEVF